MTEWDLGGIEDRDQRSAVMAGRERIRAYERGRSHGRSGCVGWGAPLPGVSGGFEAWVSGGRRAYVLGFRDGREERLAATPSPARASRSTGTARIRPSGSACTAKYPPTGRGTPCATIPKGLAL